MPSANNEFSDSVSIQSVVIEVSSSISKVEISSTVTDIDIYEHIDKPYLTAVLGFVDIEDVVGSLDITGGEKIHITLKSVRTNTTVPVSKTFHIDKVMTADKGTDVAEFFVLHLIEDIGYTAVLHNVNRAYSGKPKDIISDISKEYFDKSINTSVDANNKAQDHQKMKVIVPNLNPVETMCWIKNRASTGDGFPYYLFSTLVGEDLQFRDLKDMMTQTPVNETPWVFSESGKGNEDQPDTARERTIIKQQTKDTDNLFKLIQQGLIGSKYNFIDVTKNEVYSFDFDLDELVIKPLKKEKIINKGTPLFDNNRLEDTSGDITSRTLTQLSAASVFSGDKSYMESEEIAQYKLDIINRAMVNMLLKNKLDVIIDGIEFLDGKSNTSIGNTVSIQFLRNTRTDDKKTKFDRKKSGDFLIVACKHSFTPRSYYLTLSGVKLSNGEVL